jgi:hypothetical protein
MRHSTKDVHRYQKRATLDVLTNLAIKDQVWLDPSYDQREESASLHQFFSKFLDMGVSKRPCDSVTVATPLKL